MTEARHFDPAAPRQGVQWLTEYDATPSISICGSSTPAGSEASVAKPLHALGHCVCAGRTGCGKSSLIVDWLSQLSHLRPEHVGIVLVDPKLGVEFSVFAGLPHLMAPVACETAEAEALLECVSLELEQRFRLFQQSRTRNIRDYRAAGHSISEVIVAIDELPDLILQSRLCNNLICRIAAKGRAAGVYLWYAAQRVTRRTVPVMVLSNTPTRICFATSSRTEQTLVFGEIAGPIPQEAGEFIIRGPGFDGTFFGRSMHAERSAIARAVDRSRQVFADRSGKPLPSAACPPGRVVHLIQTVGTRSSPAKRRRTQRALVGAWAFMVMGYRIAGRIARLIARLLDAIAAGAECGCEEVAARFRRRAQQARRAHRTKARRSRQKR